ncbi:MAG: hypothetical protein WD845_09445 [Pirellulales bacterium]
MQDTRRGVMLLEALVAGLLLAVMLGLVLRALSVTAIERRRVDHRAIALQEAAGVLERATALSWDDLDPQRLARIQLSPTVDDLLPQPTLVWTVTPDESQPGAKRIRVDLAWRDLRGQQPASVRLNYWAYAPAEIAAKEAP